MKGFIPVTVGSESPITAGTSQRWELERAGQIVSPVTEQKARNALMLVLSLPLFLQSRAPTQRRVLPRVKTDLPISVSLSMTALHRHGQRLCPLGSSVFSQADN